jgi:hypothetical protein
MIPIKRNKLEVRAVALPRSGHHGVIGWLFGHFAGEILHYNDVVVSERGNPAHAYLSLNTDAAEFRDLYVFNIENRDLSWVVTGISTNRWGTYAGPSDSVRYMLVQRDPYNNFASYFKTFGPDAFFSQGIVTRWKQYAREFLGETHFFPENTVKVSFTDWFLSKDYRRMMAERLGLEFCDDKFRQPYGPDSAFESGSTDASQRKVMDRWKLLLDDPVYVDVFRADKEINELAEAIYGDFAAQTAKTILGKA